VGTWLVPAPARRRTLTRVRLATINALGDSHTRPGGNKDGRGWLQSARRTILLTRVILRRRFSLVGLQEFQAPQQRVFRGRLNPVWRMHALKDNAVVWRRVTWKLLDQGQLSIPYFHGHPKPMPWAILKHRRTGKVIAFLSTHNPASVHGDALAWRREGWRREAAWARQMLDRPGVTAAIVVGDKNSPERIYRPFIEALGGKVAGVPEIWGIDWIVGWGDITFTDHRTSRTRRIEDMTDHPVEQANAVI
jgi:hypothetical protein